jgi:hypothetical protein
MTAIEPQRDADASSSILHSSSALRDVARGQRSLPEVSVHRFVQHADRAFEAFVLRSR